MGTFCIRILGRLFVLSLLLLSSQVGMTNSWGAAIKDGDACSPEGATFKQAGTFLSARSQVQKLLGKVKRKHLLHLNLKKNSQCRELSG
jgi:hypothetical protein